MEGLSISAGWVGMAAQLLVGRAMFIGEGFVFLTNTHIQWHIQTIQTWVFRTQ